MKQQLYDLPDGWGWETLKDITNSTSNISPIKEPERIWKYIDISSIDNTKFLIVDSKEILGKNAPSRARKHIILNDIIFATTRPNLKNIAISNIDDQYVVASTGFCVLRAKKDINYKYLFYYLTTDFVQEQVKSYIAGAAYPAITDSNLKRIYVPLPHNINEQCRIVKKLDNLLPKIDTAIDYLQRNIALADELFTCILSKAFNPLSLVTNGQDSSNYNLPIGWQRKTIGELCYKVTDGSHNPPKPSEEGKPMLSSRNILDGYIAWNNYRLIPNNLFEKENARTQIQNGDVLLTIVGTIGRSCVVENIKEEFTVQRSVAVIASNILEPNFLSLQLRSPELQTHFNRNAKGAAQKGIYLKKLKEIFILYPTDYEEQKSIVKKISLLDSYIKALNNDFNLKINQLTELKNSILDAAFKGKL